MYLIFENGQVLSLSSHKFLKQYTEKDGYLVIDLMCKKSNISRRVATLLIRTFVGPPPVDMIDPTVDHIDGNKTNNSISNLRWLSRADNTRCKKIVSKGDSHTISKLSSKDVINICEMLVSKKYTQTEIAKMYKIGQSQISRIRNREAWVEITRCFDFKN